MPSLSDPCPTKGQKGKHSIVGSICRACGARDEAHSAKVMEEAGKEAVRKNFWRACEGLDLAYSNQSPNFWKALHEFRTRLIAFRKQGGL